MRVTKTRLIKITHSIRILFQIGMISGRRRSMTTISIMAIKNMSRAIMKKKFDKAIAMTRFLFEKRTKSTKNMTTTMVRRQSQSFAVLCFTFDSAHFVKK